MDRKLRDDFVVQMLIVFMKVPVTQLLSQMTDPALSFYQRFGQSLFQYIWRSGYDPRSFLGALIPPLRARVDDVNLSREERQRLGDVVTHLEDLASRAPSHGGPWLRNIWDSLWHFFGYGATIAEFPELEGIPMAEIAGALGNVFIDAVEQHHDEIIPLVRDGALEIVRRSLT
jgi:hypothetical protein